MGAVESKIENWWIKVDAWIKKENQKPCTYWRFKNNNPSTTDSPPTIPGIDTSDWSRPASSFWVWSPCPTGKMDFTFSDSGWGMWCVPVSEKDALIQAHNDKLIPQAGPSQQCDMTSKILYVIADAFAILIFLAIIALVGVIMYFGRNLLWLFEIPGKILLNLTRWGKSLYEFIFQIGSYLFEPARLMLDYAQKMLGNIFHTLTIFASNTKSSVTAWYFATLALLVYALELVVQGVIEWKNTQFAGSWGGKIYGVLNWPFAELFKLSQNILYQIMVHIFAFPIQVGAFSISVIVGAVLDTFTGFFTKIFKGVDDAGKAGTTIKDKIAEHKAWEHSNGPILHSADQDDKDHNAHHGTNDSGTDDGGSPSTDPSHPILSHDPAAFYHIPVAPNYSKRVYI